MKSSHPVLVVGPDLASARALSESLRDWNLSATPKEFSAVTDSALTADPASVVIVIVAGDPEPARRLASVARSHGKSTLGLVPPEGSPEAVAAVGVIFDDWVPTSVTPRDLASRIYAIQARIGRQTAIDPRFLALTVHDLRTPLNVIGLTIRAISQSNPNRSAEFEEDLQFLQENARQIERMLAQLGDFCRLLEIESPPHGVEFDLCRFLEDFVEDRSSRAGPTAPPVVLDLGPTRPREVALDPNRARVALQHAVANASAAAGATPVRLELKGEGSRVRIAISVDRPPPATVVDTPLRPDLFERLTGSAAERRGLDLAIAARISELFGGSARLEVEPGRRSTIWLDWPDRISPPA